jgi:hypothetical protein
LEKFRDVFVKFQTLKHKFNKAEGSLCKKTQACDFSELIELFSHWKRFRKQMTKISRT